MTVIEIINQIEADKLSRHIEPHYALRKEVARAMGISFTDAYQLLKTLCDKGIIKMGNTVNDYYIKILQL
jgi:DNA-binding IclR family transcriptional regulator